MLILIINLIILQVPLSDCFKKVEPFALVNIGDYYVPEYNLSIFGVNFYESGNIIMHVYSYNLTDYLHIFDMNHHRNNSFYDHDHLHIQNYLYTL